MEGQEAGGSARLSLYGIAAVGIQGVGPADSLAAVHFLVCGGLTDMNRSDFLQFAQDLAQGLDLDLLQVYSGHLKLIGESEPLWTALLRSHDTYVGKLSLQVGAQLRSNGSIVVEVEPSSFTYGLHSFVDNLRLEPMRFDSLRGLASTLTQKLQKPVDEFLILASAAQRLSDSLRHVDVGLASDLKGDLDAGLLTGDTSGHATVLHVQMFPIRTQEIQFLDTTPYIVRSLSVWVPSAGMTLTKKEMIAAVREQVGRILSRYAFTDIHVTLSKRTPVITSGTFAGEDSLEIRMNVVVYVHPRGASAPKFKLG